MKFKEYNEYPNPEEKDYDIKSSYNNESNSNIANDSYYVKMLVDLIGFVEDVTDESLMRDYGITEYEYDHPTKEVVEKVTAYLSKPKRR